MNCFFSLPLALIAAVLATAAYAFYRSHAVFRYRSKVREAIYTYNMSVVEEWSTLDPMPHLLDHDLCLPYDYDTMMRRFWVWPLARFHACQRGRNHDGCLICGEPVAEGGSANQANLGGHPDVT